MAATKKFRLETNGHCLLCFKLVAPLNQPVPLHSIQSLADNFNNSLSQLNGLSQNLELTTVLCQDCGKLTGRFSELTVELKGIQEALKSCTNSIKEKVAIGEGSEAGIAFHKALESTADFNYDVVNSFRNGILKRPTTVSSSSNHSESEPKGPIIGFIPPPPPVNLPEVLNHCSAQPMPSEPKRPRIDFVPPPINSIPEISNPCSVQAMHSSSGPKSLMKENFKPSLASIARNEQKRKWRKPIIIRAKKQVEDENTKYKNQRSASAPQSSLIAPGIAPLGPKEDPKIRFPLEYNETKDCLMVASEYEITFNDSTKSLICKICGFSKCALDLKGKLKGNLKGGNIEGCMYIHILSKHLHVLDCPKPGCGKKCNSVSDFRIHVDTHRDGLVTPVRQRKELLKKIHKCDRCELSFRYLSGLDKHKRSKHEKRGSSSEPAPKQEEEDERTCEICNEIFTRYYPIKTTVVKAKAGLTCEICYMTFAQRVRLRQHKIRRSCWKSNSKEFPCKVCRRNFQNPLTLQKHQEKHHPDQGKCDNCLINMGRAVTPEAEDIDESVPIPIGIEISHDYDPSAVVKTELLYGEDEMCGDQFILPD